jgi:hypothetical protein
MLYDNRWISRSKKQIKIKVCNLKSLINKAKQFFHFYHIDI